VPERQAWQAGKYISARPARTKLPWLAQTHPAYPALRCVIRHCPRRPVPELQRSSVLQPKVGYALGYPKKSIFNHNVVVSAFIAPERGRPRPQQRPYDRWPPENTQTPARPSINPPIRVLCIRRHIRRPFVICHGSRITPLAFSLQPLCSVPPGRSDNSLAFQRQVTPQNRNQSRRDG